MKHLRILLALIPLLVLLSSCGTLRGLGLGFSPEARSFEKAYRSLPDRNLTAQGTLTIDTGTGEPITVPAQLVRHADLGVVLSVRPLGVMEAARITVTDEEILILDRLNKRYFHAEFDSFTTKTFSSLFSINPRAIRSLLANEPFSEKDSGKEALSRLTFSVEPPGYKFTNKDPRIELTFDSSLNLTRSYYEPGGNASFLAEYSDFRTLPNLSSFPALLSLTMEAGIDDHRFDLRLEEIRPYSGQEIETDPPAGYSRLSLKQITDVVGFLTKMLF